MDICDGWLNFHKKTTSARICAKVLFIGIAVGFSITGQSATISALPSRPEQARTGTSLKSILGETSGTAQQQIIVQEILNGNVPDFLRDFKPVRWNGAVKNTAGTIKVCQVCLWVAPDYLAVGPDSDYLRVALMPQYAQLVADKLDCNLPTPEIVDRIYEAAPVKLEPRPFSPLVYDISNVSTWVLNSTAIDHQLADRKISPGNALTAGIKKDVVITNRLAEPQAVPKVAIYGWHRLDGAPIQPLTLVHRATYVDYSQGTRLVSNTMQLDGETTRVESVLQDVIFSSLLSREGPMTSATIRYGDTALLAP